MRNRQHLKTFFCGFFLVLVLQTSVGQTSRQDPEDIQGWYSSRIKIDLPKKWAVSTEYQARFNDNLKTIYGSYITLGVEKKITKSIELLTSYRLAFVEKGVYNRISVGTELQQDWQNFEFGLRILAQKNWRNFADPNRETVEEDFWRARFTVGFDINKKTNIYASIEPIMSLDGDNNKVDNLRNIVGLKIDVFKKTKLNLFYIYNPDYSKKYNRLFHIVGLELNYTIKRKNK